MIFLQLPALQVEADPREQLRLLERIETERQRVDAEEERRELIKLASSKAGGSKKGGAAAAAALAASEQFAAHDAAASALDDDLKQRAKSVRIDYCETKIFNKI